MSRLVMMGLLLSAAAWAQTEVSARPKTCPGGQARLYAELPATVGAQTVMVPMCLAVGQGLTVDTSTTPPTLRAAAVAAPMPWLAVQSIDLGALTLQPGQQTLTVTLDRQPVEGSALIATYSGFRVPRPAIDIRPTARGRQVVIALPEFAAYYPGEDSITLVYLTVEPLPAARP